MALLVIGLLIALGVGALYALGLGPFAPTGTPPVSVGSPTPLQLSPTPLMVTPTPLATPTPTSTPLLPTESPATPTPAAPTSPTGDASEQLLSHIPSELRDGCVAVPSTDMLALASCPADGGEIVVTYFLHNDQATMNAAYEQFVELSGVERGTGTCSEETSWPAEGTYSIQGSQAGRVLCSFTEEVPMMWWTDDRLSIVSQVTGTPGNAARLYQFWSEEAGPNP